MSKSSWKEQNIIKVMFSNPRITLLRQQTTLKTLSQKHRRSLQMQEQLLNKVVNIVAKEEISHYVFKSRHLQERQTAAIIENGYGSLYTFVMNQVLKNVWSRL